MAALAVLFSFLSILTVLLADTVGRGGEGGGEATATGLVAATLVTGFGVWTGETRALAARANILPKVGRAQI